MPEDDARTRNLRRFSDNPFSRVSDKYGNDVTHERMAIRDGMLWGVRVYPAYTDGTVLVKQTVRKDGEFVVYADSDGRHRERHVDYHVDAELAEAVRDALQGQLGNDG